MPDEAFGGLFKAVFTFVIPMLLVSNVPARVLADKLGSDWLRPIFPPRADVRRLRGRIRMGLATIIEALYQRQFLIIGNQGNHIVIDVSRKTADVSVKPIPNYEETIYHSIKRHRPLICLIGSGCRYETPSPSPAKVNARSALSRNRQNARTSSSLKKMAKTVNYYLTKNEVSDSFHGTVCKEAKDVTATGTVKEVKGKMMLTATKIDLRQVILI